MGLIQNAIGETNEQEPVEGTGVDGSSSHEGMEGEPAQPGDTSGELSSAATRKAMNIPKNLEQAYDRLIKAGLRVMFDQRTRDKTLNFIEQSAGDPEKLAEGVVAVVVTLYQESNGTMPPNLIIPVGIELLVHASEVASAGGLKVGKEVIAEAMASFVHQVLIKFGATPEQMQKLMSGMDSGQQAPTGQQAPQAPTGAPAPQGV